MASNKNYDNTSELTDKRYVGHGLIANSKKSDGTSHLRTQLEALVTFAGEDGFPSKWDFYITNNHNIKLTDKNKLVSIQVPIVPPIFDPNPYDSNREANYNLFLFKNRSLQEIRDNPLGNGYNSVSDIKKAYESLSPEKREEYINSSADLLVSYILGEIGLRYIKARENNELETMRQLKGLKVLEEEGFDLDMFDLVMRTPGGFEKQSNGVYLEFKEDGKLVTIFPTEEEIAEYKMHQNFRTHCLGAGRYYVHKLSEDLERYPNIDINRAKFFPSEPGE